MLHLLLFLCIIRSITLRLCIFKIYWIYIQCVRILNIYLSYIQSVINICKILHDFISYTINLCIISLLHNINILPPFFLLHMYVIYCIYVLPLKFSYGLFFHILVHVPVFISVFQFPFFCFISSSSFSLFFCSLFPY